LKRASGVLMPIFSLPSKYGIGTFSKEAYDFIDWLKLSGQSYWQILPLGQTGFGDSPYQSFSSFAGNPYFIPLENLIKDGLLNESEIIDIDFGDNQEYIDYEKLYKERYRVLNIAYSRFEPDKEYADFTNQNADWLDDYALFMTIKAMNNDAPFYKLDEKIINRDKKTLEEIKLLYKDKIGFFKFLQFEFFKEWNKLKKYANDNGIKIIGDIPIYVSYDSVDVWSSPYLFCLDEKLRPKKVAGCPPDSFAPKGQLWGNPIYDWESHKKDDFSWWIKRFSHALKMYDIVRIDHFRGFSEYYEIPYGENTAENGEWKKGPGIKLFNSLSGILNPDNVIAEDLGFITDSVRDLIKATGFPGMKIIEFGFDKRDSDPKNTHLPNNYNRNSAVYTSTHDNQTLISWYNAIESEEKVNLRRYLADYNTDDSKINIPLISLCMRSVADTSIIPIWDILGLTDKARINIPGTDKNNWRWRLKEIPSFEIADKLNTMTKTFGR